MANISKKVMVLVQSSYRSLLLLETFSRDCFNIIASVLIKQKTGKRHEIRRLFLVTYFKMPVKRIFFKELK